MYLFSVRSKTLEKENVNDGCKEVWFCTSVQNQLFLTWHSGGGHRDLLRFRTDTKSDLENFKEL